MSSNIGELQKDDHGSFRMIDGKKIYQIEEKTEADRQRNEAINAYRTSGFSRPSDYLKSRYY